MKNLKKIIAIILILILILLIVTVFIWKKYEGKPHEDFAAPEGDQRIIQKSVDRVTKKIDYYSIELIVNSYLNSIITEDSDTLYNILHPESIKELKINKDNVVSRLNDIINQEDVDMEHYKLMISDMYFTETEGNIAIYFVYGKVMNTVTENIVETSLMVETDTINDTYYVLPFEYMDNKGYSNIEECQNYVTTIKNIENNSYNEIEYQNLDDYTTILNLMTNFIDELVYNVDDSYNLFSDEYKKEKFDTLDKYKEYIKNNMRNIIASSIEKYKINEYDDYTEYVLIDQYGNYYIFKETAVMEYTVQLDTYTIDSQEFLDKYNNGSEQLKVGMNLEKIFQALNRKDYEYIYGKLNTSFKENNFPTLDNFKTYVDENFFAINKINYGNFQSKSGVYVYDVTLTDAREIEENSIEKSFIVKLGEGTDFEISFSI